MLWVCLLSAGGRAGDPAGKALLRSACRSLRALPLLREFQPFSARCCFLTCLAMRPDSFGRHSTESCGQRVGDEGRSQAGVGCESVASGSCRCCYSMLVRCPFQTKAVLFSTVIARRASTPSTASRSPQRSQFDSSRRPCAGHAIESNGAARVQGPVGFCWTLHQAECLAGPRSPPSH
jgi:hypothetical protein